MKEQGVNPIRSREQPADQEISIWVVEDDDLYRETISALISETGGMRCDHSFGTLEEALQALGEEYAPEIILMDIGLPGIDGIKGSMLVKEVSPATDVIILTIHGDDDKVFQAICAGASGYLLKSATPEEVVQAISDVLGGGAPLSPQIARKVLERFSLLMGPRGSSDLTRRESEILKLMVEGLTKRGIAERLFLSYYTVDTHIKNIYAKLHVHSRSGAVARALKENLL